MPIKDALLAEFDHEMATTRRLLDRLPEAELAWRPHDKSMALGELARHITNLPHWCSEICGTTVFDLDAIPADLRPNLPASRDAVTAEFDSKVSRAREQLARATDPEMMMPWTLKKGGHEIFTLPRISAIRSFVMNHLIHHRGQLSVYLRLKNIPLPPIYGPTADEQ